jgi:uncharacterized membrane protein YhhN
VLPIYALVWSVHQRGKTAGGWASSHAAATAAGLVFSSLGDVLLEVEDRFPGTDLPFLFGLGAFLVAHWVYAWGLSRAAGGQALGAAAAAYAFAACFFEALRRGGVEAALAAPGVKGVGEGLSGDLVGPVAVYALSIATMLWVAARRFEGGGGGLWLPCSKEGDGSRTLALGGAFCFVVSDAVLGYSKFARPLPHAKAVVMVTYYSAQVLLALAADGTA